MNKQMSFYGLFFGCILFLSNAVAIAQTKLTPKDLAFISFNTDGNKNFDFISLVNLTAGTEIRFTDNAYVSGSGLKTNEGILIYTAPGLVTKGTVISYSGVIGGDWVLGDAGFNPSGSGDNILVYQGSEESPTFIFGIGGARSSPWISSVPTNNNSNIPETLSEASHTIVSLGAGDNYQYDTSFGNSGNASELLILITEPTHFTRNDAIAFSPITSSFVITDPTWTGNTNTDWALSSNWLNGLPTSSLNAYLPNGRLNYPIITATSSADCNHLFLESSAELTINSNSGNSGSIIVKGTSEGNITYNRYVSGSKWHLLASPVSGQAIGSLLLNATNAISVSGSYYNMKAYQEDLDNWGTRFTSSISGIFTSGKGYATQRNSDGIIRFSGSIITDDLSVNLSRNNNGWNLIGNPYTSSIGASLSAGTSDYCLSDANCNELDDSYAALYLWDEQSAYSGNRNDYRVINNAGNGSLIQNYIQAGQGFFVKAKSGGGSFHFTPSMRVHKTSTPIKSDFNLWSSIVLKATIEQISQTTSILYHPNMTKGLDISYDAGLVNTASSFSIYTQLVDDNGIPFMLQCLPTDYENLVVPLGLNVNKPCSVSFSVKTSNFPENFPIILEDRLLNVFYDLSKDGAHYDFQLEENSSETGRFYIHTSQALAEQLNTLKQFRLIADCKHNQLILSAAYSTNSVLRVFSSLGQLILVKQLAGGSDYHLYFNEENGVYIAQITNEKELKTQKFVWVK